MPASVSLLNYQRKTALVGIEQQRLQNPSKKYLIFIETERDLRYNMDGEIII